MEPQKRLLRNHIILACLLTVLFTGLALVLHGSPLLEQGDLLLYDLHFRWRGPVKTADRIALVLMDQRSATELERKKGSWSRAQMATAIENLSRAGADIIGLDLVFFAPGHEVEEDRVLAKALEGSGRVVLAKFVAVDGRGEVGPLPLFQEHMIGDGFINMFPDRDGVLREAPFLAVKPVAEGVAVSPSFALEIVRAFLDLDFALDFSAKDRFSIGGTGQDALRLPYPDLRIYYFGGDGTFPRLSYTDVVHNRFHPDVVRGRIVLVGSSLATDKDFFPTPFSGYRRDTPRFEAEFGRVVNKDTGAQTPGVACHAHAVETILQGRFIGTPGQGWVLALTLCTGLLGLVFYGHRPGALWGFLLLVGCLLLLLASSHYLFVRHLQWVRVAPALGVLVIQYISGIALQRAYGRKRTALVTGLFGKYVSPGVVTEILSGEIGAGLEGRAREVTVLFSDLRGFTTLSETLSPEETGRLLNVYFDAMIPIVFRHGGTLDKLMGDAVMAFFGAPGVQEDHPEKAAESALEMVRTLQALREGRGEKGIDRLHLGIGLNTGDVTVGNLGSSHFMDYTVIGDTVNLGSRLEGLNKTYGTQIILSEFTARRLD
ncbi:MAG: adenylate/guanylate cyclase domain-containing protein, partial [Deltaproteobacteria bacterium]|nr:adenylate/guanylate cyclase domain-containing protein [Deltaproteobacteria bacterium]